MLEEDRKRGRGIAGKKLGVCVEREKEERGLRKLVE